MLPELLKMAIVFKAEPLPVISGGLMNLSEKREEQLLR